MPYWNKDHSIASWRQMTGKPSNTTLVDGAPTDVERTAAFIAAISTPAFDRRAYERVTVCRPVTLYFDDCPRPISAILRDISVNGVGLLHEFPLKPGNCTIRIPSEAGDETLCARLRLLWCEEAARHYYLSGAEFLHVFDTDPIKLTE